MASIKIVESLNHLKTLKTSAFAIFDIKKTKQVTTIESVVPFRVKFINVGIPGYGRNNPAPIGIAIIGYTNYIL